MIDSLSAVETVWNLPLNVIPNNNVDNGIWLRVKFSLVCALVDEITTDTNKEKKEIKDKYLYVRVCFLAHHQGTSLVEALLKFERDLPWDSDWNNGILQIYLCTVSTPVTSNRLQ